MLKEVCRVEVKSSRRVIRGYGPRAAKAFLQPNPSTSDGNQPPLSDLHLTFIRLVVLVGFIHMGVVMVLCYKIVEEIMCVCPSWIRKEQSPQQE